VLVVDPATAAAIARKVLDTIVSAVGSIRKFYDQPDGWPLEIQEITETPQGWTIIRAYHEMRQDNLFRAECPKKVRERFDFCGRSQYIIWPTALDIVDASRRGYAFILWSDDRSRWQSLPPEKLAELSLSLGD